MSSFLAGDENKIKRSSIIWNSIGGALNAGQVAIILIFVSYKMGHIVAGMITIAYAIANLFMSAGKYGIRTYQVTDVEEVHSFGDYFWNRCTTIFFALIIAVVYAVYSHLFQGYSAEKTLILGEIIVLKMIDAFVDVFYGRFQQNGRLDIGAKIMAIQCFMYTAFICVMAMLGFNIHVCMLGGIISSILSAVILISVVHSYLNIQDMHLNREKVFSLLKTCFSLCVGITLSIYVGNIPKYLIDAYMNEHTQAIFGYIMMPVFVVTLLNQFIYQPTIKDLGDLWNKGEIKLFKNKVIRQCLIVAGLTIFIIAGGLLIGLPILSVMYNADLTIYRTEFAILLIGGSLYALAFYLNVPITTIRKQRYIAIGYVIASVLSLLFGKWFVKEHGMFGASLLYLFINILLVVFYMLSLMLCIRKIEKQNN